MVSKLHLEKNYFCIELLSMRFEYPNLKCYDLNMMKFDGEHLHTFCVKMDTNMSFNGRLGCYVKSATWPANAETSKLHKNKLKCCGEDQSPRYLGVNGTRLGGTPPPLVSLGLALLLGPYVDASRSLSASGTPYNYN